MTICLQDRWGIMRRWTAFMTTRFSIVCPREWLPSNIVATININKSINLEDVMKKLRNAEYNPKVFSLCVFLFVEIRSSDCSYSGASLYGAHFQIWKNRVGGNKKRGGGETGGQEVRRDPLCFYITFVITNRNVSVIWKRMMLLREFITLSPWAIASSQFAWRVYQLTTLSLQLLGCGVGLTVVRAGVVFWSHLPYERTEGRSFNFRFGKGCRHGSYCSGWDWLWVLEAIGNQWCF